MKSIHGKDIKIFACNSNKKLAEDIAAAMGLPLGRCTVGAFADGEVSISIEESVRGSDVFVVQSTCGPVNNNLMELLIMIDALKRASAGRITAVVPYYGYAARIERPRPAIRSPPSWWPISSLSPVPTVSSAWTSMWHRFRASSISRWIT